MAILNSTPSIKNCSFTCNRANRGGGIYISDAAPVIENCQFVYNWGRSGGGIAVQGMHQTNKPVQIIDCLFQRNNASEDSFTATHRGGGVLSADAANLLVHNTEMEDNHAEIWGAGFECVESTCVFTDCLFASNSAGIDSANLGVSILQSETSLQNCILCDQQLSEINGDWQDLGDNIEFETCDCPDTNGDGLVDVNDILAIIESWGDCWPPFYCPADVDGDGTVNVNDVLLVIGEWGVCE